MCAALRPPLHVCLAFPLSDVSAALDISCVAAKSMLEQLGIDTTETDENHGTVCLAAQPLAQLPCVATSALPFCAGNVRSDALLPVVVQPRMVPGAAYTAPHAGAARGRSNPVVTRVLRGRGQP